MSTIVTDKLLIAIDGSALLVVLVFAGYMAAVKTFGIAAIGQVFQLAHRAHIKFVPLNCSINGLAVYLSGASRIVGRLCAALNF